MTQPPESPDDRIDALAALAAGEDTDAEALSPPDDSSICMLDDTLQNATGTINGGAAGGVPGTAKRRAEQFARRQNQAHALQFKKVMFPLLVVVSAMLLAAGLVSAAIAGGAEILDVQGEQAQSRAGFLAVLSFPVAAFLAVGAWLFHREIKNSGGG